MIDRSEGAGSRRMTRRTPSRLTHYKIRQLELATGAPFAEGQVRAGHGDRNKTIPREAEHTHRPAARRD